MLRNAQKCRIGFLSIALVVLALFCASSRADMSYDFTRITTNSSVDVSSQLTATVYDLGFSSTTGYNQVGFRIENAGPTFSAITEVYFDDGTILGLAGLNDKDDGTGGDPDVDFSPITTSGNVNLPSGGNVGFYATAGFNVDADPAPAHNGVHPGDFLEIIFDLKKDPFDVLQTYDDVLNDLATGNLRIGLHVQRLPGIDDGDPDWATRESDSFVNVVPVPGAALLGALGLSVSGHILRRRKELA